jgi:peptidoglycan/LPS O-acetylase OafA/YrhL
MKRLGALTSLRFFAAAMIVTLHAHGHFGIPPNLPNRASLGAGVSIFFVLSGFILAYVYPEIPTKAAIWQFWRARFARVWPAHIVTTLIVLWWTWSEYIRDGDYAAHLVLNATMTQTWVPLNWFVYSFNGPSWSISTEFFFYAAFPFLIVDFARTWWWKLLLALASAVALMAISLSYDLPVGDPHWMTGTSVTLYEFPGARMFEFVLGMSTALGWRSYSHRCKLNIATTTVLELAAVGILAYSVIVTSGASMAAPLVYWWYSSAHTAVPSAALIFILALQRGLISRTLCLPILVFGGEISYSIYLVHFPMLSIYWWYEPRLVIFPTWLLAIGFFGMLLAVSAALWAFVERPMRAILTGHWELWVLLPNNVGDVPRAAPATAGMKAGRASVNSSLQIQTEALPRRR